MYKVIFRTGSQKTCSEGTFTLDQLFCVYPTSDLTLSRLFADLIKDFDLGGADFVDHFDGSFKIYSTGKYFEINGFLEEVSPRKLNVEVIADIVNTHKKLNIPPAFAA